MGIQQVLRKLREIKKGVKPVELHPVLSWTEGRGGICGLSTVLLYSVTIVVQHHLLLNINLLYLFLSESVSFNLQLILML